MAIYYFNMKSFGRAGGSSAVSAAAYRAGERLRDERTGKTYDHSARLDVLHKEIMLPGKLDTARMAWAQDRATLWNQAERAEMRQNARVAREYLVALPAELPAPQQIALARGFSRELTERYGSAVDLAVHAPRDYPGSDPRNFHAHLLATTREVVPEGFGAKTAIELSSGTRFRLGLTSTRNELLYLRERWASVANEALRVADIDVRIDHRSLAAQGIDREPLPRIPTAAWHLERQGYLSFAGTRLRADYEARVAARAGRNHEPRPALSDAQIAGENWFIRQDKKRAAEILSGRTDEQQSADAWAKYAQNAQADDARDKRESDKAWARYLSGEPVVDTKSYSKSKTRSTSRVQGRSRDDDHSL